jgi:uncharacterized protein YkwD
VNGTVVDYLTGSPVSNVSLTINSVSGTTTVSSERKALGLAVPVQRSETVRAPLSLGRTTQASANGAFSFGAPPSALVAISASAPGYISSLNGYTTPAASGTIRPITLVPLTSELSGWLALVNSDRAANGAAPVTLDGELTIAALAQALDQDTYGYAGHWNHLGQSAEVQCSLAGTLFCAQNGGGGGFPTYQAVEAAYVAEKANCPGGVATGCPYAENTGHFINLTGGYTIIGLGAAHVGGGNGYTQNFAISRGAVFDPTALPTGKSGAPVSVAFRLTTATGVFANIIFESACPWQTFTAAQLAATSPGSPYPGSCSAGVAPPVTLAPLATDRTVYVATFTPLVPGVYLIGLADAAGWVASAPINVPN